MREEEQHSGNHGQIALLRYFICLLMVLTSLGTAMVIPSTHGAKELAPPPDLEAIFPDAFGDWERVELAETVLPAESVIGPGEAVAYRAWRNSLGRIVTLVVAYGPPASDSVRLHRPETCYVGQGFHIERRPRELLRVEGRSIPVNRLMATKSTRKEAVSYWLRAGDDYATSAAAHQWINLRQGLGRRADGVLVRISTFGEGQAEFDLHMQFSTALLGEIAPAHRSLLVAIDG